MDRAAVERSLLLTEERLAECEQRIAIQLELIVDLKAQDGDTTKATLLLDALRDVQRGYVTIRDRLRAELGNPY